MAIAKKQGTGGGGTGGWIKFSSKWDGNCGVCGGPFLKGDVIYWKRDSKARCSEACRDGKEIPHDPRNDYMDICAKFNGTCDTCGGDWHIDDEIVWKPGGKAYCSYDCIPDGVAITEKFVSETKKEFNEIMDLADFYGHY